MLEKRSKCIEALRLDIHYYWRDWKGFLEEVTFQLGHRTLTEFLQGGILVTGTMEGMFQDLQSLKHSLYVRSIVENTDSWAVPEG